MLDLKELWIGDRLKITSSGRIGLFKGIKNNKARLEVGGKILLIEASRLIQVVEKEITALDLLLEEEKPQKKPPSILEKRIHFKPEIDLHVEKLDNRKSTESAVSILEFQLRKLQEFIAVALELNMPKVTIIHGKGTGVLKSEVMNLLQGYDEIKSVYPTNQEGAVIVYF